jgi:2-succinyl-5-enolpyruvyl-6-hydroxy-3-cyclohexene-1-carboxylate synthase
VTPTPQRPTEDEVAPIADQLRNARRGVIVCGPLDDASFPDAALRLAEAAGYPLLADVLSQMRCGPGDGQVIDNFDAFLRDAATVEALAPDLMLRFGATPVSKPLSQYIERNPQAAQIVVGDEGTWTDPQQTASAMVHADPAAFCQTLTAALRDGLEPDLGWLSRWRAARDVAAASIEATLRDEVRLSEPGVFRRLPALLPEEAIVFAGNSMPVRDLDSFVARDSKPLRFLANRGTSGIDGVTSTALGVAAATGKPVVLTIGDLSFYHDMNGLLAARRYGGQLNLTIVLINNDGGGIFSFLPQQTEAPDVFEELFGTPHGLDFRYAAEMYGLEYTLARSPEDLDAAVSASVRHPGVCIVEVRTRRNENLSFHGQIWRNVREALAAARS